MAAEPENGLPAAEDKQTSETEVDPRCIQIEKRRLYLALMPLAFGVGITINGTHWSALSRSCALWRL
ncbi:MAG: hypothetical protein BMS9Abin28_0311 [Anaerolineae bacterium]|nr:MAG: hypothetical protein BMS9Abin28_0311 [Anaerolineae bacterium]